MFLCIYDYLFCRFSVNKQGNDHFGNFYFLVDGAQYAYKALYTVDSDPFPSASATITIELLAGQVVQIENVISTLVYGTNTDAGFIHSWFTGYLLYAIDE